jgi:dihydropyrimidinase
MNVDYSGYEGWPVTGKVEQVFLRGQTAIKDQEVKVAKGYGRFVKRGKVSKVV